MKEEEGTAVYSPERGCKEVGGGDESSRGAWSFSRAARVFALGKEVAASNKPVASFIILD